jgi:DNA-binding NarL/FixJ family response regulator
MAKQTRDQAPVPLRVVTVDDQAVFRRVAREVIEATAGFEPLGEASSGEQALALADEVDPQLVLVDVRMPEMNGLETARRLSAAHPEAVIVLISSDESADMPSEASCCGAVELLRKEHLGPSTLRRLWSVYGRPC